MSGNRYRCRDNIGRIRNHNSFINFSPPAHTAQIECFASEQIAAITNFIGFVRANIFHAIEWIHISWIQKQQTNMNYYSIYVRNANTRNVKWPPFELSNGSEPNLNIHIQQREFFSNELEKSLCNRNFLWLIAIFRPITNWNRFNDFAEPYSICMDATSQA